MDVIRNRNEQSEYERVAEHVSNCDSAKDDFEDSTPCTSKQRGWYHRGLLIANLVIFTASLVLFGVSWGMFSTIKRPSSEHNHIWKQISQPSPLLDSFDIPLIPKAMNATFMLSEPVSIFRQDPSHEVDLAWERLGDTRPIPLTREEVIAMGIDPDDAVKFPENFGLGSEAYAGRVDMFHQIHCLDALRREIHFDHYYGAKFPGGRETADEWHQLHASHCVYYLLQNILCSANTDVYTHIWTDGVEYPWPDFGITHQCKDFDAIKHWHDRNSVSVREFSALKRPKGAKFHRMSRHFKELVNYFEHHEDDGNHGDEIG